jgi:chloramphenicol-sensitive protein RarD
VSPAGEGDARARRDSWLAGVTAYALWGVVPVYWKQLGAAPAVEVLAHRAVWGLGAFALIAAAAGQLAAVRAALRDRKVVATMALSGALLAVNWGTFVYAVETDRLLHASLGYFINPLVSVALGTLVLGERLRRGQQVAIALAAAGVAVLAWQAGTLPWIALVLAATFGAYGLVRKTARVPALAGSAVETLIMAPIGAAYLVALAARGDGLLGHASATTTALLVGTGVITAVPLVLFTVAARRLPLSTIGFLQYLAPTGQLVLAVAVYDEPFDPGRLVAFGLIWAALAVFTASAWRARAPRA